jgi:hypothetical protein
VKCAGLFVIAAVLAGCQLPAERIPLKPLPPEGEALPYSDLIQRTRLHATIATEAFYADRWPDLEEAARGLEQTARFLPKATEVPAQQKAGLAEKAGDLSKDAAQLREAAKAKDDKRTNEVLQRIHLQVRSLRPEG